LKKLISFIIILLIVMAGAYFLFSDYITETLNPGAGASREAVSALCVDNRGNVYYVLDKDGKNHLVGMDNAGNVFLNLVPEAIGDSSKYLVTDIFVSSNSNIVVAAAAYDRASEQCSELSMNVFFEDGAFAVRALNVPCDQNVVSAGTGGRRFTSVSEDEANIYFGLYDGGRIELFAMQKGTYDIAAKLAEFRYALPPASCIPAGGSQVIVGEASGQLSIISKNDRKAVALPGGVVIGRIWAGGDGTAYIYDAAAKDVYKVRLDTLAVELMARGTAVVDADEGVSLGDFRQLYISSSGIIAGLLQRDGNWEFFTGGSTYMDNVAARKASGFNLNILGIIGIAVGAVLLALLVWDAFVGFFKMRMPLIVRSGILIIVSVVAMLYLLLSYIIAPSMRSILTKQYKDRLFTAGSIMASAISAGPGADVVFGSAAKKAMEASENVSPLHFDLISSDGALLLSSDGFEKSYDTDILPFRIPLKAYLDEAAKGGAVYVETYEPTGPRMYVLTSLGDGRILSVASSTASVEAHISDVIAKITDFLTVTGAVMVVIFILIDLYTAVSIRKLKKCVDAVSAGNYDITARVSSGDEVESLAGSFNTMTRFIRENMLQLERSNKAYYRFVPENLMRILGVSSIEELGKQSYVKDTVTVLVTSFRFAEKSTSAEELFKKINQVTERIAPVVMHNNGTVYDFKYDGFHAVFDENTENAVRAAVQIRQEAEALNAERASRGEMPVDVRIVISSGEVMLGIIGDENRMSASAVSEVINTANALVDICRDSDIYIGCTRQVFEGGKGYRSRYVGVVELKNELVELIDIYDGDPYPLLKHKEMYAAQFAQAVEHFYNRNFKEARYLFMQIVQASRNDGVSRNYMYFADQYSTGGCSNPTYRIFN